MRYWFVKLPTQPRRGVGFVYTVVALLVLMAFSSLAVDFGRIQLAKSELQQAADAAARYAATGIADDTCLAKAKAAAAANKCDGSAVELSSADVRVGNWDSTATPQFSTARTPFNAVEVTARRTTARSNGMPLVFGRVAGVAQVDVTAKSIALFSTTGAGGFVGLNGVTVKNNAFIASYNSSTTINPTQASAKSNGGLGSNGTIDGKNNNVVKGSVKLGPNGSLDGFSVTGTTTTGDAEIEAPAMPTWAPSTNPGGISQNYVVNHATTLPGGTYWFTSLNVSAPLSFTGVATLNINGNVLMDSSLTAYNSQPGNLTVYQLGANRSFGDDKNNMDVTAVVYAPGSDFVAKNNFKMKGTATFSTIEAKNNVEMYYDEAIGGTYGAAGATVISNVK